MSLMVTGPDTRCYCDTNPQLQPSLATPLSRTPSTAPPTRTASSRPPASPTMSTSIAVATKDIEVTPFLPTLCYMCNCDDTDIDTMYRTCCITAGNSPTSLSVTTLFDTGANPTSFVNRQVAAWIESQQSPQAHGKRKHSPAPLAAVSLAGTSQSSPIYGSVVFNLTFFNEVTRSNETLYRLHANVIDSCIDIIVGRPVIREHHLIQKIPHYFDETTSSRPDLSQ